MQIFRLFFSFFLLFALTSCEKEVTNDPDKESFQNENVDTSTSINIKEAQELPYGTKTCVKGYIIGATYQSISNLNCVAPFEGSTAIVLGPRQADDFFSNQYLFPVCLTDASKGIRENYNLEDNPALWNKYVYIFGETAKYMYMEGLRKVTSIVIDENHIPDDEELQFSEGYEDEDENEEDENHENGDEGTEEDDDEAEENSDNSDSNSEVNYLTVAQAKEVNDNATITVQGYIVATATESIENISYKEPFSYSTSIILADKPIDSQKDIKEQFDTAKGTKDLLTVCLTDATKDAKNARKDLNLKDHSDNQNKIIRITGKARDYLNTFGMKLITKYEFITIE